MEEVDDRFGEIRKGGERGGTFHLLEKQRGGRWILANRILFRNLEKHDAKKHPGSENIQEGDLLEKRSVKILGKLTLRVGQGHRGGEVEREVALGDKISFPPCLSQRFPALSLKSHLPLPHKTFQHPPLHPTSPSI